MTDREAFEKIYIAMSLGEPNFKRSKQGIYVDDGVFACYEFYKACSQHYDALIAELSKSHNEVIEKCAMECNKIAWSNKNTKFLGAELNALKCEEAIRKLKENT